jgi:transcriptional regulator with XRE-family HTH domain
MQLWQRTKMRFGERVRQLRQGKKLTLRGLAAKVGVGFTYPVVSQ